MTTKNNLDFIVQLLTIIISLMGFLFFFKYIDTPSSLGVKTSSPEFYVFCLIAIISNLGIIYYHAVEPPHPKFLMTGIRKFWIRVHAISGSFEVILGVIAWFMGDHKIALIVGFIALFGHVPLCIFSIQRGFWCKRNHRSSVLWYGCSSYVLCFKFNSIKWWYLLVRKNLDCTSSLCIHENIYDFI